ncbi:MAG TPA: Ig-like domain-containing protein [Phycisphaerae bacterium]|nr:Ig-like domain-containing protein [Phycisphaerae bacterium]
MKHRARAASEITVRCLLGTALVAGLCASGWAADPPELKPYLRKAVAWKCEKLGRDVPLQIYYADQSTGDAGAQVIVYLKNAAWPRIGQEPDLPILRDNIRKQFIVITVDFGDDPKAVSTFIDKDLHDLFRAVYGVKTESLLKDTGLKPINYRCFFMPAGYRVATDLVYWEIDKHAVHGTMEYIMQSYNEYIVPKVQGLKPASSPRDMVDRQGKPFDYTVKMDIVYPSQAKGKLPVLVNSETISERNPNSSPSSYRPHYLGFTLRGYVHVVMGHCFNPCVNHYFHFIRFELDHWNGLACYTAAMRYLRKYSDRYAMDTDHIGMIGHSKGQYAVTRLSDPNHAGGRESQRYSEFPKGFGAFPEGTPEPQPWPGYASTIHAGYQSMGMGTFEPEFITSDYVPTIYACGEEEQESISKKGFPMFARRLEELDVNHISMLMEGMGHDLASGYDRRLGVDRYQLVHDFFDRYLKPGAKLPPVVLMTTPRDGAENVPPGSEIVVHFAPVIDEQTIHEAGGITVVRASDDTEVKGRWRSTRKGTRFVFVPEQPLEAGTDYRIDVAQTVRDTAGTPLQSPRHVRFKTGN